MPESLSPARILLSLASLVSTVLFAYFILSISPRFNLGVFSFPELFHETVFSGV